ncbi:hypothetical protein GTR02_01955 [Kineococcus sp. R8]|nr:hypothetical protein [Kineococcus siccus]
MTGRAASYPGVPDHDLSQWQKVTAALEEHGPPPCAASPEAWWPVDRRDELAAEVAAQVCARCPLLDPCGRHAAEAGERDGVCGGVKRAALPRRRAS